MIITASQIKKVCPRVTSFRAVELAHLFNTILPKYKINTPDRLHEFIASMAVECQEFRKKAENMRYTSVDRLLQVFPSRLPTMAMALQFLNAADKLGNYIYDGRMGNNQPGDGYRFRGGGFLGMTGRDMYHRYGLTIGKSAEDTATLVQSTDFFALDSAAWIFAVEKGLLDEADDDDFFVVTRRITGSHIGMADREIYYDRAKKYI